VVRALHFGVVPEAGRPNATRPTRLAEIIAGDLRDQILRGELSDGDRLPPVDRLVERYQVSPPSIREALRVLETEGLINVQLGRQGGATIRRPRPERAAYMLGLVLEAQRVRVGDLAGAIRELALACVRSCARREDRATRVLPVLRACLARAADLERPDNAVTGLVQFHQALTSECGNDTLVLVAGSLEALWAGQNVVWPYRSGFFVDVDMREGVLDAHRALADAIEAGAAEASAQRLQEIMIDPSGGSGRRRNPVVKALPVGTRPVPSLANENDFRISS
jgi:GntR family transcriptional regulator, transcriptional repressor for pyruvate dehydrogenase complex